MYDWLARRFGYDAVFMDVSAIPFAVNFPDFIRGAIQGSSVMVVLIGPEWHTRIHQPDDPVRMEVETALAANVPVLPVLIGSTPMPNPEDLPTSIGSITVHNAAIVGVLQDFDTHMKVLLPKIESILGKLAVPRMVSADPQVILSTCQGIVRFLHHAIQSERGAFLDWRIFATSDFGAGHANTGSLYLHRISQLGDLLELHLLISFWTQVAAPALEGAGLVMQCFERFPVVPAEHLPSMQTAVAVKMRRSDEDPRQVWKMITDYPLQLSLAYIATVSPVAAAAG